MHPQSLFATKRPEYHHHEWKWLKFGKNWCTGEIKFHRCSGEMISPVFHWCTSVKYRTLCWKLHKYGGSQGRHSAFWHPISRMLWTHGRGDREEGESAQSPPSPSPSPLFFVSSGTLLPTRTHFPRPKTWTHLHTPSTAADHYNFTTFSTCEKYHIAEVIVSSRF